jgi:hypothetical protein
MVSSRQIAANRANALRSTGPRSPAGKDRSKLNALRHGAFAELAVVPQLGETAGAWAAFRDAVVADLGPAGPVEAALAGRAAHLLWRLQRVAAIDAATALIATALPPDPATVTGEGVLDPAALLPPDAPDEFRLARVRALLRNTRGGLGNLAAAAELLRPGGSAPDGVINRRVAAELFAAVGVAAGWGWGESRPRVAGLRAALALPAVEYGLGEWTAGAARAAVARVATELGMTNAVFVEAVVAALAELQVECEKLLRDREDEEAAVAGRMAARRLRALAARALPSACVLDKVIRQEGHLGRQLDLTLRQLERLQAARTPASPVVAAVLTGFGAGADVAGENGFVSQFALPNRPAVAPGPATRPPTAGEGPERWAVR